MIATALLGFLVALPSRRLVGDYLAIVTLFFGQFFVTVVNNGNRISVLGFTRGYDVTGGPNGIADIDRSTSSGARSSRSRATSTSRSVFFLVAARAPSTSSNESRTGRAWRSLREDPLAAEMMGMPVNRLKLIAFAFGAGVAGLTGTLFASLNTAVFAADFDVPLLITIYAMLILGGAGSLGGVILGALVVNVSLEVLRTPNHATWIFYVLILGDADREAAAVAVARRRARRHGRLRLRRARDRSPRSGRARPRARASSAASSATRSRTGCRCRRTRASSATGRSSRWSRSCSLLTTVRPRDRATCC